MRSHTCGKLSGYVDKTWGKAVDSRGIKSGTKYRLSAAFRLIMDKPGYNSRVIPGFIRGTSRRNYTTVQPRLTERFAKLSAVSTAPNNYNYEVYKYIGGDPE